MKLQEFIKSGKVPHALCFVGDNLDELAGISESTAQLFLCEHKNSTPCKTCNSCVKSQNKTHPDIIRVREDMPDDKYKIDGLRKIISEASLRPNDGEYKVYIFTEADTMSPVCQNSLLKFTEEPPEYVRIIFTAKSADLLLETIKSRLVFINAETDGTVHGSELSETAKSFINAINTDNEYMAATALSKVKNREELSALLDLIAGEIRDSMHNSQFTMHNWVRIQKFVQTCIDDLTFNPNVALFCTYIVSGIFKKL
jgi:DNA polymerase III delta prime subunit